MSRVNAQKCQVIPYFGKTDCDQPSWPGLFITMPFSDEPLSLPMWSSFLQRLGSPHSSPQRGHGSCPPMQCSSSPQAGGGVHPREAQGGSQVCLYCLAQSRAGRVSWCLLTLQAHLGVVPRGELSPEPGPWGKPQPAQLLQGSLVDPWPCPASTCLQASTAAGEGSW